MKHIVTAALLALAAGTAQAESAAAASSGTPVEQKAQACFACHGPAGAKPILPEYPILAGQYANYLAHALHEYKSGKRKNPIMTPQAAQLGAEDIEALARYFESQSSTLYTPAVQQ